MQTKDLIMAAALRLNGFKYTMDVQGRIATFTFEDSVQLSDFVSNYDMGGILVEPLAFNNEIKRITTTIKRLTNQF